MRPTVTSPLSIRGVKFGGEKALFCVPLVAADRDDLLSQARTVQELNADLVEWRADSYQGLDERTAVAALTDLRGVFEHELILFTLRIKQEGGKNEMGQEERLRCIEAVLRSGMVDIVDIELCNGSAFVERVALAARGQARVILSFHDFTATPDSDVLFSTLQQMFALGADIAKMACMPKDPADVLRLMEVTLRARKAFPAMPLCTMSMGGLGSLSRVAGFLYGSDMAFAVGREVSAPGQIPLAEARSITESLLRYA